ncbi:hypothetical protein E2C01_008107 [Portunus trituberculatus]|uniref:Uncharacterized protein n=1 Tax=Portunus trituberculatus TaxID=210409 RepID=A0A5B7D0R5_PORTR|nr:hypothetical protein [Portunus trituberculatus]
MWRCVEVWLAGSVVVRRCVGAVHEKRARCILPQQYAPCDDHRAAGSVVITSRQPTSPDKRGVLSADHHLPASNPSRYETQRTTT